MSYLYENFRWRPTNAPTASRRYDDIWFHDARIGWAVNSDGDILRTDDGGDTWRVQTKVGEETYLRCVGFADTNHGWVGTFNKDARLYHTSDGGADWNTVDNLPNGGPEFICGLCVVNPQVVYAAGTNRQTSPVGILKTVDGGVNWQAIDMSPWAASLVDIYFENPTEGWVVGSRNNVKHPDRAAIRGDLIPVVLHTTDGGVSWTNLTSSIEHTFPQGEWGWKFQKVTETTFVVSNQNYRDGAILRTDDGGATWRRLRLNDRQRNSNLEGIGFLDENRGWVGGWGDLQYEGGYSSETWDRGGNWENANHIGFRLNRFRFIGDPVEVVYASGDTIYKFTDTPVPPGAMCRASGNHGEGVVQALNVATLRVTVPEDAIHLTIVIWDRFGDIVRRLVQEESPTAGDRFFGWDFRSDDGAELESGPYVVRVSFGATSESQLIYRISRAVLGEDVPTTPSDFRAQMLELLESKRRAASFAHSAITTHENASLNRLFKDKDDDAILAFLEKGLSSIQPYVGKRLVVPGDPDGSVFVTQIERGAMAGRFSPAEVETVRGWILALGRDDTPVEIDSELLKKAESIDSPAKLHEVLQGLLRLEHATIPPYLTATFSLDPTKNGEIRRRLRRIAIDEMVHMGLVANLIVATGGTPRLTGAGFVPTYPGPLPFGVAENLIVGLEAFSKPLIGSVFRRLEAPEKPLVIGTAQDFIEFKTIGDAYAAVSAAIERLGESIFTNSSDQVSAMGGRIRPMTSVKEAGESLRMIAEEGEGTSVTPFPNGPTQPPAHFYALEAIYVGKALVEMPGVEPPYAYSESVPIPYDPTGVYPIPSNPKLEDYVDTELAEVRAFSESYSRMLDDLEAVFGGAPKRFDAAIGQMYKLSAQAGTLAPRGLGLVFDYLPPQPSSEPGQ